MISSSKARSLAIAVVVLMIAAARRALASTGTPRADRYSCRDRNACRDWNAAATGTRRQPEWQPSRQPEWQPLPAARVAAPPAARGQSEWQPRRHWLTAAKQQSG